jgi:hypothetical protein
MTPQETEDYLRKIGKRLGLTDQQMTDKMAADEAPLSDTMIKAIINDNQLELD